MTTEFEPYVTSARRYLWLAERDARVLQREYGIADAYRDRRLALPGTPLARFGKRLPGASTLTTAGILAVEEVIGASVDELVVYGLGRTTAEALQTALEGIADDMTTFGSGPNSGQIYDEDTISLIASTTKTASYTSDVYELGDKGTLRLDLAVTAISGTGARMHVQIETCKTSGGTYRVVDAFTALIATGTQRRTMSGLDRFVRAVCTLEGSSPSVTFSLTGEAV